MWIFLATELLLFGSLFTAYAVYRILYPAAFQEASQHLNLMIGAANTFVLLLSSIVVALAVRGLHVGTRRTSIGLLVVATILGSVFLVLKLVEYAEHYRNHLAPGFGFVFPGNQPNEAELFFILYFVITGLHAIHLTIGIVLLAVMLILIIRNNLSGENTTPLDLSALYWHFVDVIWVFLFPLLYLAGRH
jgi:cytochrome c oxidase subunit 3